MKYTAIINKDKLDGGYFAQIPDLKGCFTQAETLDELKDNIQEAILLLPENKEEDSVANCMGAWELKVKKTVVYAQELIEFLKSKGFVLVGQKGSHMSFKKSHKKTIIIPVFEQIPIKRGLLNNILYEIESSTKDLTKFLQKQD